MIYEKIVEYYQQANEKIKSSKGFEAIAELAGCHIHAVFLLTKELDRMQSEIDQLRKARD